MKNLYKLLLLSQIITIPLSGYALESQEGSGESDGYKLVWQDLFDNGELNPDRWNIEVNGSGGGNNELQYYTDRKENVRVGDDGQGNGCLILTARREEYKNKKFTSGRVNSLGKIAFTHGKIEASIKLPKTANGLWPAFWMMGNDYSKVGWPRCGETDILEMGNADGIKNDTQETFFNGACHWGQGWPNASYAKSSTKSYSLQDGEFHLFTCIWDENSIRMYVDLDKTPKQNPYYKIDIPQNEPDNEWSAGNYFHKDNFILFNLAVGGNFTGIHEDYNITALNDDNNQEASYYVNYIKIYQKGVASEHQDFAEPGDSLLTSGEGDETDQPQEGEGENEPGESENPDTVEGDNGSQDNPDNGEENPVEGNNGVESVKDSEFQFIINADKISVNSGKGIFVYDLMGKLLRYSNGIEVEMAGLPSGTYIIKSGEHFQKILR